MHYYSSYVLCIPSETVFLNYNEMSENNSEYSISEFRKHLFLSLMNVKYIIRNKWFDHVTRLFLHVKYLFYNTYKCFSYNILR